MSSWVPTAEKPFLGNFVEFQANLLSQEYDVTFLRLLSQFQKPHKQSANQTFNYVDVFYKKSKNPILTYFSKKKALKKALKNIRVELIHGHISFPDGWMFRLVKSTLNIPLVVTEHGSYYSQKVKWNWRMNWSIPKTLKSADKIIAVSSFLANDMYFRFPNLKINVIGNHLKKIDVERVKQSSELTFLHISTLSHVKNVTPIFYAFSEFLKTNAAAQLMIVSDENSTLFQQLATKLNLTKNVSFHGPIEHEAISKFYQQADCFIMNSDYESFSIVMAEAWQAGLPIISTPVGIASDMNAECGLLTDGSTESILRAMQLFVDTKNSFDSKIIQQHVDKYSENEILNQLKSLYFTM